MYFFFFFYIIEFSRILMEFNCIKVINPLTRRVKPSAGLIIDAGRIYNYETSFCRLKVGLKGITLV